MSETAVAKAHLLSEDSHQLSTHNDDDSLALDSVALDFERDDPSANMAAATQKMKGLMASAVGGDRVHKSDMDVAKEECSGVNLLGLVNGRQRRILIVDDSSICTTMLGRALSKVGYAVDSANNGKEAVAKLSIDPCMFDAVIMDVIMPIMNGIEATKTARTTLKLKTLPIFILTADVSDETRIAAMSAGATDFILKPAYTKVIIKLLHGKGLYAQAPFSG